MPGEGLAGVDTFVELDPAGLNEFDEVSYRYTYWIPFAVSSSAQLHAHTGNHRTLRRNPA